MRLPTTHRVARTLAQAGVRGASVYWSCAERLQPIKGGHAAFDGIVMPVNPRDYGSLNMYRGLYERAEVKLVSRLLGPGMVAVDVGANIGYYTRLFAKLVGPSGRVEAFEPNAFCWPSLTGLPSQVTVHRHALGDRNGVAQLRNVGDADHNLHASLVEFPEAYRTAQVDVRTLDDVLDTLQIGHVTLLKIDVEGFDEYVLRGAHRLIEEARFDHLLVEISPEYVPVDFVDWLVDAAGPAYRAHRIAEHGRLVSRPALRPVGGETRQYNLLLSRGDKLLVS